jgi:dipeptidyl aminopeptidase/acylaminoacyl peptidase
MRKSLLIIACLIYSLAAVSQGQVDFNAELLWKLKRLNGGVVNATASSVLFTATSFDMEKDAGTTKVYIYNLANKSYNEISSSAFPKMIAPKWMSSERIAFLTNTDKEQSIISVNSEGEDPVVHATFDLGSIQDFLFSPNANYLVTLQAVKVSETIKEQNSDLPNANAYIKNELMYRHWDTWKDEYRTHLFLHTVKEGKVNLKGKDLLEGEPYDGVLPPFGGLDGVSFSKDEEKVVYVSKKQSGGKFATSTNSDLYTYSILEGTTINTTKNYKGYDTHPSFSPNGKYMAWLSMEKDGFESDKNTIVIRDLTDGSDEIITKEIDLSIIDYTWSSDEKTIYFLANINATNQLFTYDLKKGKYEQITDGIHDYVSIAEAGKELIAMRQSMLVPNDLYSVKIKNGEAIQLTDFNADLLGDIAKPTVEKRWITTSDNKKMLTWVILPPNFDEKKKYPALLYCQGGPQSPVSQFFSYRWNFRLMASEGYVVIAPNRRGLPGFGQEWNDAISKDWGGQPMLDYLAAVDEVKKEKYVDESRIGAVGASYGGYSVYYLAGIHEGRFKSFISHCGLFNMTSWYGSTEEIFFANWELGGPYWLPENQEGFIKNSPHTNVGKWDTPMLVIHGGKDYRVPENQGLEAFQAAQLLGLKSRLLYFPTENHWILQPQNALLWHREFYKWLRETL